MSKTHWVIVGGFLTALSVQMATMHDWSEAVRPAFVAGVIGQLGAFLAAMLSDRVEVKK